MNPLLYFSNPVFFFTLLFILLLVFILTIRSVFSQDKKAEEALKKAISDKDAFEKELKGLQEEIARLKAELSLKTQMFEGLKGQYNELEKDYEKLAQKAQESGKDAYQPKNTPLQPQ
jgi:predicted nuclease with TOPRIM domain